MKRVGITETILRDANQSLIATRLPYEKFEGILEDMDKAGFYSVECWGGATFDVCLRFLNEDPWERLRKIRAKMPNTKLQMLLRGQNILGYKHYSDDVVRRFVRAAVKNGIDIIRIFDALNDLDNLKVAIEETVKSGAMASGAISYTTSPVHTLDKFDEALLETPRVRKDMGYPPLVTPTSQLVGTQAVQNVLSGERYKNVGAEMKAYCRGEYGKTPAPIDPEVRAKILGDEKPIEGRYADTLPADTFDKAREYLGDTARCEEDVLSYIAFPQVAETFFEKRREAEERVVRYSIREI